ncbi:MAG: type II secretion system protein GspJ [Sedimentisphaerales bacterium]|nr:type II secretion system protein GspJ [Sedimentisphaerales bacterium]
MALGRRQDEAFTLLELLVAMVLMVVVASCLYTALYTGFRAYRSALSAVEPTLQAANAIELLKEDIDGVLAPGSHLAGAFTGTDSAGAKGMDADSLEFYTTHIHADDDQLAGGLGRIELLLEADPNSQDGTYLLVRRLTTNLLAPKEAEAAEQVLCRRVVSMNLRYFDGSGWVEEWDSTADANSLPLAVEVDIQIAHNGKKRAEDVQKRRLVQSFALPCQTPAQEESETTL